MKEKPKDDGIYDLSAESPRPAIAPASRPNSKPAISTPLQYRSKKANAPTKADAETIKNLHMPMWLLSAGVAIQIIAAFLRDGRLDAALIDIGLEMILGTAVMLGGILLAARIRRIDLGQFWIATFKLAAITVAPAAAVDLASPLLRVIPFGGLLGLAAEFVLYFALLGALFDLDESDTWYCVWTIFLVRLALYFAILGVQAKWG